MTSFTTLLQASAGKLGEAPRSAETQLLDVDGSVFIMLSIFLVLLLILWQFLWKPYLRVRDERVSRVEGAREQAAKLEAEAAARLSRIEAALAEARRTGGTEVAKLRIEAQTREQQILAEAQNQARAMLADARGRLDALIAAEKANLRNQTTLLGREIAEKALGRRLSS